MPKQSSRRTGHNDAPLAKRAARGDSKAWSELVDRYSGYVIALLRSARVPTSDEPDAFQYVFVELFKALADLRNQEYLAPWLRQAALRHAIRLRTRSEKSGIPLDDVEPFLTTEGMDEQLEQAERRLHVRETVATLSDRCRELVERLFFADPPQPYAEVAAALGIKVASIGMTRQRCLETLERALRARGLG